MFVIIIREKRILWYIMLHKDQLTTEIKATNLALGSWNGSFGLKLCPAAAQAGGQLIRPYPCRSADLDFISLAVGRRATQKGFFPLPLPSVRHRNTYSKGPQSFGGWPSQHFFHYLHCKCTVSKIRNKFSQKWNCAASISIFTLMYLWALQDVFPWSVRKSTIQQNRRTSFSWEYITCSQIHECRNWVKAAQFHFLGTFVLNFCCSVAWPLSPL
jgi:hypothetical protein